MEDNLSAFELITLAALFAGPVSAVVVGRLIDWRRAKYDRRMDIFKTLMRTRRSTLHPDHVGALNLVEIEFYKEQKVIDAWSALFSHFQQQPARRQDEEHYDGIDPAEKARRDTRYGQRVFENQQRLLAKLISEIAKALRFEVEQIEIIDGGYFPQGHQNVELENQAIRQFMIDLYQGRRTFPIGVMDYRVADQSPQSESEMEEAAGLEADNSGDEEHPKNGNEKASDFD